MDKKAIQQQLLSEIKKAIGEAETAADNAHAAATDDESVAETQYDTLAIESAYLAQGHSARVDQLKVDLLSIKEMVIAESEFIETGALFSFESSESSFYFIAPAGAGITVTIDEHKVTVITPSSPLAKALWDKEEGEEILLPPQFTKQDEIAKVL